MAVLEREVLHIDRSEQADFLTKLKHLTFLHPYLGQARSVSEAAELAQVKLNQMHYFTKKMLELGLIEIVNTEKQRGRTIHYYRSVAAELFVPLGSAPFINIADYFKEVATSLLDEQVNYQLISLKRMQDVHMGFWIFFDEAINSVMFRLTSEEIVHESAKTELKLPFVMSSGRIRLSKEKAELARHYLKQIQQLTEDTEGDYYLYRFVMTPEAE